MTDRVRQSLSLALLTGASLFPAAAEAQTRGAANYVCEGTMARVVNSSFTGDQRGEWSVSFRMSLNRAGGTVMIFSVSGAGGIIKAGRHTLAADGEGRMAMSWSWTDQTNTRQPVTMTISRSGEFEGAWNESNPAQNVPFFGELLGITLRGSFSGVCWQ